MSILGVMGPIMIGPSSSHTAGAARLGRLARMVYGRPVNRVEIVLFNSFAETGAGHGTDRALIGGLLGMEVDDERLKRSPEIARAEGLDFSIAWRRDPARHPNYVEITFHDHSGRAPFTVSGISVGGGSVKIVNVNGLAVGFSGRHDVLLLTYRDLPGLVGFIGETLGSRRINIATMHIARDADAGTAAAFLALDGPCAPDALAKLREHEFMLDVTYVGKSGDSDECPEED